MDSFFITFFFIFSFQFLQFPPSHLLKINYPPFLLFLRLFFSFVSGFRGFSWFSLLSHYLDNFSMFKSDNPFSWRSSLCCSLSPIMMLRWEGTPIKPPFWIYNSLSFTFNNFYHDCFLSLKCWLCFFLIFMEHLSSSFSFFFISIAYNMVIEDVTVYFQSFICSHLGDFTSFITKFSCLQTMQSFLWKLAPNQRLFLHRFLLIWVPDLSTILSFFLFSFSTFSPVLPH